MTIGFAEQSEKEILAELRKICFGDEDEYISGFFENRFNPKETLVIREDKTVCSMLFLLPGEVKADGEVFSAAYLYGACTHPDYRSNGYMGELLDAAKEHCSKQGIDFICLVPAQESLFSYYAKHGYKNAFEEKTLFLSHRQLRFVADEEAKIGELTADEMFKVRSAALSSCDCFAWGKEALKYAILENRLGDGKDVACFEDGRCVAYALFYEENEKLIVRECAARRGAFGALAKALLDSTSCDVFFFRLPLMFPLSADEFKTRYNAMMLPLNSVARAGMENMQNAYMGLTLG